MKAYIHQATASEALDCDLKTIVPDALMRRRMSRIVRDGVTAAAVCAGSGDIDAIITATAYGCLSDSEKFLRTVLDQDEQLLTPTPFIQSTFNTIGATVALLERRHCYNMTYAHGAGGFGAALLDATMLLADKEARKVLVGAIEEVTPTLRTLLTRMRVREIPVEGGAFFFLLSPQSAGACAEIRIEVAAGERPAGYSDPLAPARQLYNDLNERKNSLSTIGNLQFELRCM